MTLARRAFLVILPVVVVSNLLVALGVYWVQRGMIEQSETTRFFTRMSQLADSFSADLAFNRNLVFSMLGGDIVRAFVREENPEFQVTGLSANVQEAIRFFSSGTNRFVSFAIVGPDELVDYYFESSDDPFAEIRPAQVEVAKRLLESTASFSDEYIQTEVGGLLVRSQLVDRRTFKAPLSTQRDFVYVMQSAIKPIEATQLWEAIVRDYGTKLALDPRFLTGGDSGEHSFREILTPELTLSGSLPDPYLTHSTKSLKAILALGSVALSLLSVGFLIFLIRRTVTGPIATLDAEVKEVIDGRRERLEGGRGKGEIARLSLNIKAMHDETLQAFKRVQEMSWTDSLTGIGNRPRFNLVGNEWMSSLKVQRGSLSLLFIDLDNFKNVNDTFGHAAGDSVLKSFSRHASNLVRAKQIRGVDALLARLAGDEFAILLRAGEDIATELAGEIVQLFSSGLEAEGTTYPVSASIGIASAPASANVLDDLISCADVAMYHAKAAGRNGYAMFSPSLSILSRAS